MKKTFRSLAILAASAWAIAATASTVYVPTDQGAVPRSHIAVQTTDQPARGLASNDKDALTSKNQVDKMSDARTPDKVMADANNLPDKVMTQTRMPATFQAMVRGEKRYINVGGEQQVAQAGSSPPQLHLKQVGSQYLAKIETGRVTPQPSTDVGARSRTAVVI